MMSFGMYNNNRVDIPWYRQEKSVKTIFDFIKAIDWQNEKPLQAIIGLHFLLATLIILSWSNPTKQFQNFRIFLWLFIITLCVCTEKINEYLSRNYKDFGFSEQYFDSSGKFIMLVWAVPLLILVCVLTFKMLNELWNTLIEVKVKQLKVQHKKKQLGEKQKGEQEKKEKKKDK